MTQYQIDGLCEIKE